MIECILKCAEHLVFKIICVVKRNQNLFVIHILFLKQALVILLFLKGML